MKPLVAGVICIALGGMVVIWYNGHQETQEWYERVASWDREHAAELVRPHVVYDTSRMITINVPQPGAIMGHSFVIKGHATGAWYFEGSFPVEIQNENGVVMQTLLAHATGGWIPLEASRKMQIITSREPLTGQVSPLPSEFSVDVSAPYYTGPAKIVFKKANPSGLPENDASVTITITIQ